jgi:hypothetical protein
MKRAMLAALVFPLLAVWVVFWDLIERKKR